MDCVKYKLCNIFKLTVPLRILWHEGCFITIAL